MTRDEVIDILLNVQAYYPNFRVPNKTITVNAWYRILKDYEYKQVQEGLDAYVRSDTSGFAPGVGEIIDKIYAIYGNDGLNETSAWAMVWKAIRNSGYHSEEEFDKLPPVIQRTVGSPRQLREWAIMEDVDGKTETVLQSSFQRSFRVEQKRERDCNKLALGIEPRGNKKIEQRTRKELTAAEERMIAESAAVKAPDDMIKRVKEAWDNDQS